MSNDERHYNSRKLTILFAVSSLILLGSVLWMTVADYSREWKNYQAAFRTLEIERTRVKFDKEENVLGEDEQYQALL
mgnify:CR=1 FL=1